MNDQEHKLVVMMLAQQLQLLMVLVEALKAKGLLEPDDLQAYDLLIHNQERHIEKHLFVHTCKQYEDYAGALGIPVNLKDRDRGSTPSDPASPRQ